MYSYNSPNKIIAGAGAINEVGKQLKNMGLTKTLIVADKNMTKIGLTNKIETILKEERIRTNRFDAIETEPTSETIMNVTEAVRKYKPDSVIGLGGGSSMDTAKAASIMATNDGDIRDYTGNYKIKNKALSTVLIPTTAGTGSETTYALVFTEGHDKKFVFDPKCIAELAVIDPMTTLTLPPAVTAMTGMDALSHAIESLLTINSNPLTEAAAHQAIYLIFRNIRTAYNQGKNLEARSNMMYAATLGGLALNSGGSWAHSVSYTVGSRFKIPHGLGCAISLPFSMKLNLHEKVESLSRIAEAAGEDTKGLTPLEAAHQAIFAVRKLLQDLRIPLALKDLNVPKEALSDLAEELRTKYPRPTSPYQLTEADAVEFYEEIWAGKVN